MTTKQKYSTLDDNVKVAMGRKNLLINGGFDVWQRGAADVTVLNADHIILDRWKTGNSTGTGTITASKSTLGNYNSGKLTATAAVTDIAGYKYVYGWHYLIESQDVFHLNGKDATLSFLVETNWSGILPVSLRNAGNLKSYVVNVQVVSGQNVVKVTVPFEVGTILNNDSNLGLSVVIGFSNEDTYVQATKNEWVSGNYLTTPEATPWVKTLDNFINVTNVQLELGSEATEFEQRSYGEELARCQRYYQSQTASDRNYAYQYASGYKGFNITFPVQMRDVPTATFTEIGGSTEDLKITANTITRYIVSNASDNALHYLIDLKLDAEL